jgi:DnaB-like helicase N terminal domain/AAA domain
MSSPTPDFHLPHSHEAERAFLGGLILAEGKGPAMKASDFFLPFHRSLYESVQRLVTEEKPIDLVLLNESLSPGEIQSAGGITYLASLVSEIAKVSNLEYYAEIIRGKARHRNAIYISQRNTDRLLAANSDVSAVFRELFDSFFPLKEQVEEKRILSFRTAADYADPDGRGVDWVVRGLVAKGAITELGAKIKAGKTTLVLALVRAVLETGDFLSLPTSKTPVVFLTEQPAASFRQALERAGLNGRKDLSILHFTDTSGFTWPEVAAAAVAECKRIGSVLMVVDTLSQFAGLTGDRENNSGDALEAMRPLQTSAAEGIGNLVVRHERKSGGEVGDSGRGSSAFAGVVDIVLSMRRQEGNAIKTRRVLQSLSRFSETPSDLMIALEGDHYISLGPAGETALEDAKRAILKFLPRTEAEGFDLRGIATGTGTSRQTVQRSLDELLNDRKISKVGKGIRGDPYRYYIPETLSCPTSPLEGHKTANDSTSYAK